MQHKKMIVYKKRKYYKTRKGDWLQDTKGQFLKKHENIK